MARVAAATSGPSLTSGVSLVAAVLVSELGSLAGCESSIEGFFSSA